MCTIFTIFNLIYEITFFKKIYLLKNPYHYCECKTSVTCQRWKITIKINRTSLVVQRLRMLPIQDTVLGLGTGVWSLVWEDPTCLRATKPVHQNYWSPYAPELVLRNKRSHRKEKPSHHTWSSPCLPKLETADTQPRRPGTARNKFKNFSVDYLN